MQKNLICVAVITTPHGIRGAVKVKTFTQSSDSLEEYAPLYSKDGNTQYDIKILSKNEDMLIVQIKGVSNRNDAEILKGRELYADKNLFPQLEEDEFYYDDLIGMEVVREDGTAFGEVLAMHNYGSGDLIEIKLAGSEKTDMFSFTKDLFPEINIEDGTIVILPPDVEFVGDNDN